MFQSATLAHNNNEKEENNTPFFLSTRRKMSPILWPLMLLSSAQGLLLIIGAALLIRLSRRLCGERRLNSTVILKTILKQRRLHAEAEALRLQQEQQALEQQQQQQQQAASYRSGVLGGWRNTNNNALVAISPAANSNAVVASPSPGGTARGGVDAPAANVVLSNSAFDRFTFALLSMLPIVITFCCTGMWIAYVMRSETAYWVGAIPFFHGLAILAASMYSK